LKFGEFLQLAFNAVQLAEEFGDFYQVECIGWERQDLGVDQAPCLIGRGSEPVAECEHQQADCIVCVVVDEEKFAFQQQYLLQEI
jgi:hypothetical protein